MDESRIKEALTEKASEQGISCRDAFKIAEDTGAPTLIIGKLLNELNIKVRSCQLGCFD